MAELCPRCGLPVELYSNSPTLCAGKLPDEPGVIACRDREITTLKARVAELESQLEAEHAWESELALRDMGAGDG